MKPTSNSQNPFLESMVLELMTINQNINYNHQEEYENLSQINISNQFTVEKQEHTKLYHTSYDDKLFFSTSYKTRDVLLYILLNIKREKDYIDLNKDTVCSKTKLSKNSFYAAIKELAELGIICRKEVGVYWVNPKYIFNGNRKKFFIKYKPESIAIVHNLVK